MGSRSRDGRALGAAFVAQFATSLAAGILSAPILAGSISQVLVSIPDNTAQIRATILLELFTSAGILVLTSLLYVVLRDQQRIVALCAFVFWVAEAVLLAVSTLGLSALLTLSGQAAAAGAPPSAETQTLGAIFLGFRQHAADIALLFFGLGALPWYALLFRSRVVPRVLSGWGLAAAIPVLVATLLLVWDRSLSPSLVLYLPYVPFELVIGLWLLVNGGRRAGEGEGA